MTEEFEPLSDHTLLCGFGRVGQQLAKELAAYGQRFVIIDTDARRLHEARRQGMMALVGDCTEEAVLERAGVERARYVACVLSDDAANVFLTLTVRELNPSVQIIARAETPSSEKKLLRSGANRVVLPTAIGATKIANLIARPAAEAMLTEYAVRNILNEQLEQLGLKLRDFPVTKASRLIGEPIGRIEAANGAGFLILGIQRADGTILRSPPAQTIVAIGDSILALGHGEKLEILAFKASPNTATIHRGMQG